MEQLEPSHTVDGNIKWYNHFGKLAVSLKILHFPYVPHGIVLPGIYSKEMKAYVHKKVQMLIY